MRFELDRRGPTDGVVACIGAGIGALMFAWLAAAAAVAFVVDEPGPGEGGRLASLGFLVAFSAFAYLAGEYAWRGRKTVLVAYRSPGTVTIDGDWLTIESPGVLLRPLQMHRGWVANADAVPGRDHSATSFCGGLQRGVGVIRLREPIGIPHARRPPSLPRDPNRLPDPAVAVEAIALDFKDRVAATEAIDHWARGDASSEPPPVPFPARRDNTTRNRRLVAWGVLVAALASTYFTLPS